MTHDFPTTIDLTGRRILVVEDDYALARELCADLKRHGATVLGPAPTSYYAINLMMGRRGIDSAILDIGLHGQEVYDLADLLRRQGVPMVFATGYGEHDILAAFRNEPRLQKPVLTNELVTLLDRLMRGKGITASVAVQPVELVTAQAQSLDMSLEDRWGRIVGRAMRMTS
ncbi:response regulator [Arsenicitalea aurantiaca]|uniref:Response regulator n=1 Tax=Arsenicitalea aurantiaca TaxID=1783274 RepID=A0A433X8F4_9HYPH|nr:response regulator [Arsenicitalea aurantiaca]RUT30377.1 response regulator [Arsenicitalea aurantiaca]